MRALITVFLAGAFAALATATGAAAAGSPAPSIVLVDGRGDGGRNEERYCSGQAGDCHPYENRFAHPRDQALERWTGGRRRYGRRYYRRYYRDHGRYHRRGYRHHRPLRRLRRELRRAFRHW